MASAEPEDSASGQPQGAPIPVDDPNALLQGDVSGISGPPSPPSGGEESERTRSADGDASASTRPPHGFALRLVQDAADEAVAAAAEGGDLAAARDAVATAAADTARRGFHNMLLRSAGEKARKQRDDEAKRQRRSGNGRA